MKRGELWLWYVFFMASSSLVGMTELAPGIFLNPGFYSSGQTNSLISSTSNIGETFITLNSYWTSNIEPSATLVDTWVNLEVLGNHRVEFSLTGWLGKVYKSIEMLVWNVLFMGLIPLIFNILAGLFIGGAVFVSTLAYQFIPHQNAKLFGFIVGGLINMMIVYDLVLFIRGLKKE